MEQRINFFEKGQDAIKALHGINTYLTKSQIEKPLLNLIYFRVSQINGCAYCLDMQKTCVPTEKLNNVFIFLPPGMKLLSTLIANVQHWPGLRR